MRRTRFVPIALALFCLTLPAVAEPDFAFGPQTFELTGGEVESFTEVFAPAEAGAYVLYLRNGDHESSRVSAATVTLNGRAVISAADLEQKPAGLHEPVELQEAGNELVIDLEGPAGSFVTLAIGRPGHPPVFIHGRLLLPWGRNDDERQLALALKNGSARFPRTFRVVFFNPDGSVAAASERLHLPPRGSAAAAVEALIGATDWSAGSVEIFYAGPGTARLFGSARHRATSMPVASEVQPLEHAGGRVVNTRSDRGSDGPSRRR